VHVDIKVDKVKTALGSQRENYLVRSRYVTLRLIRTFGTKKVLMDFEMDLHPLQPEVICAGEPKAIFNLISNL